MKSLFVMLVFFSLTAYSLEQTWTLGPNQLHTINHDQTGWMINLDCNESVKKGRKCEAFEAAKNASMKKITREDRSGGKNPASVMCKSALGGKVLIAKDSKGNQNSFCLFEDHSFISNASLMQAASHNDRK